jgi:hypothetical protein
MRNPRREVRDDVERRCMLALLFAIALIALTLFVLTVAGALFAVLSWIALVNVYVVILGRAWDRRRRVAPLPPEPWQPSSFRRPPEPSYESEEQPAPLIIYRQ